MSLARDDVQRALVVLDAERLVEIRQFRPDLADDEAFLRWANQPLLEGFQIESDAQGVVSIMSPTGWSSGPINARIIRQLDAWAETHGGYVTESSAMYHLAHVGRRVPDAAWISRARLQAVPPRQRRTILPVAPEFVVEVRSETDDLEISWTRCAIGSATACCSGYCSTRRRIPGTSLSPVGPSPR